MVGSPTVILFGISGVGKTTAAQAMLARFPGVLHFQASTLLKNAHNETGEALRTASEARIAENQAVLAGALRQARAGKPAAPAIVDAHSVIDNDQTLVDLPLEIFAAIGPTGIAFLKSDPEVISSRRLADARRRPYRSVEEIDRYQARAEAVAAAHAAALASPFEIVESDDHGALARFVFRTLRLTASEG